LQKTWRRTALLAATGYRAFATSSEMHFTHPCTRKHLPENSG